MNIKIYSFISVSIIIIFFNSSCCVIPEFVQQECIRCDIKSSAISDIGCEVAILDNSRKTRHTDIFLSYYADSLMTFDVDDWTILHNNSKCKIKKMEIVKNNKVHKIKKHNYYGRILIRFSFKEKYQSGDIIELIKRSQINNEEQIKVTVILPNELKGYGFFDSKSKIRGLLPKIDQ